MTLGEIVTAVLRRQGDLAERIWTRDEVTFHVVAGYQEMATTQSVFFDLVYLENVPRGFSYTQPWEKAFLIAEGFFDYGCANFTAEVDRRALGDERLRLGPANHTSPFEATDGWLATVGASVEIPATADVPRTLTNLDRVTWDARGIDAMQARALAQGDSRYEVTKGEVFGYLWQKDGIRTLRKVRVPSAQADTATVAGAWGALRDPTDLSTDQRTGGGPIAFNPLAFNNAAFFTDPDKAVFWGIPRRMPGHHPIGPESFGAPRRPFLEGKNVRVEHFRLGRAMNDPQDVCELPDRYALYLRDYTQARLLERPGPGQDLRLAAHFQERYDRGRARLARRLRDVDTERTVVFGGDGRPMTTRPPRPSLPWAYGARVR